MIHKKSTRHKYRIKSSSASKRSDCRNDTDPLTLEPFRKEDYPNLIRIGNTTRKNCYEPESLYFLYRKAVENNSTLRDPLNPAYRISQGEIDHLVKTIRRQQGRRYRPPVPPPRPRYKDATFAIKPFNEQFDAVMLDRAPLGYIPRVDSPYREQYIETLNELWRVSRLLEDFVDPRGNSFGYRIRVPILKPMEYWKASSSENNKRWKELIEIGQQYL